MEKVIFCEYSRKKFCSLNNKYRIFVVNVKKSILLFLICGFNADDQLNDGYGENLFKTCVESYLYTCSALKILLLYLILYC